MKRMIWLALAACFALILSPLQALAANQSVNVVIDDKPLQLVNIPQPFIEKGRTLVPVRGVFEQLGLRVTWDQKADAVTITGDDVTIVMKNGATDVTVNGKTKSLDVPVQKKQNRLFVSLRFVVEEADMDVKWDQQTNTVYLTTTEDGKEASDEEEDDIITDERVVEDTEAFLKTLIEKNSELNSFSAKMDIEQEMAVDGETLKMDIALLLDFVVDPLGMYQHMKMTMEELNGIEITTEAYMTKDGYYMYDSTSDQWIKYDIGEWEDYLYIDIDPQTQFEIMNKFIEDLTVYERDDVYEIHFDVSNASFQELLEFIVNFPDVGFDVDLEELGLQFQIEKMNIVSTIDKETFFPIRDEIDTKITMNVDGEEMSIVQRIAGTYDKHNEIDEIVIPQDVIDSAISFEDYLEKIEAEFEIDEEEAVEEAETVEETTETVEENAA